MDKKMAAVFPYDMEFEPVLRHSALTDMVSVEYLLAPEGCIAQKQVGGADGIYTVKEQLTAGEMEQVELLWLTDSFYQVSEEAVLQKVKEFAGGGKDILLGRSVEDGLCQQISSICQSAGVGLLAPSSFMKEYHSVGEEIMKEWEEYGESIPLSVRQIRTPVIVVLGDGELCDKFEIQLMLRERMMQMGYQVCSISSRTGCEASGVYSHPAFMNEKRLSETEKIVYYNNYIKKLEKLEHPDVFILGIPGGMLPLSKKKYGDFGVRAYEIFQAVTPDFLVLSLHMGEYNRKYLEEMKRLFQYRFSTDIDCFFISSCGIDSFSFHQDTPLKYLDFPEEKVREAIGRVEGISDIYSRQDAGHIAERVVEKLTEYAQAEVM